MRARGVCRASPKMKHGWRAAISPNQVYSLAVAMIAAGACRHLQRLCIPASAGLFIGRGPREA